MRKPQEYKIKDTSYGYLKNHGFYFRESLSYQDFTVFVHRFPVYKWGISCTLEGEFMVVQETGEVRVNVFDAGSRDRYASWYVDDGTNDIVPEIDKKIEAEMSKCGIRKKGKK